MRRRTPPVPKTRRHKPRVSRFLAGVIGLVVIGIAVYVIFGGSNPFASSPFVLRAMFLSPTSLHIPSEVRTSGVNVGQVVSVRRVARANSTSQAALVTMNIDRDGLPVHADATVQIVPRIFLEGNYYVDLQPGTPEAPVLHSGGTLPAPNTSGPVQLDRVLNSLTTEPRRNLQTLLQGFGAALNAPPTRAQDATQDPIVRGLTGGQALNLSLKYSADAFEASSIVNQALLGIQPHDLSHAVKGNEQTFRGLAAAGGQLPAFVIHFNQTLAALAARQQALSQTIGLLPPWLSSTDRTLGPLDRSFPPTRAFAKAILPGIEQLGPTIDAGIPWLTQASALFSKPELGNLVALLRPAVQKTAVSLNSTKAFVIQADILARCFDHTLVPTGNEKIKDPPVGTGLHLYQELFQSAVGLAGASQNFDGNGRYIRTLAGGGGLRLHTSPIPGEGPLWGNFVLPPLGTRPAWPGSAPPVRGNVACYRQAPPNLNSAKTGGTP
jgi:phospholipid/cholesterol/gamma-HCH transport system substrate-binding protein